MYVYTIYTVYVLGEGGLVKETQIVVGKLLTPTFHFFPIVILTISLPDFVTSGVGGGSGPLRVKFQECIFLITVEHLKLQFAVTKCFRVDSSFLIRFVPLIYWS